MWEESKYNEGETQVLELHQGTVPRILPSSLPPTTTEEVEFVYRLYRVSPPYPGANTASLVIVDDRRITKDNPCLRFSCHQIFIHSLPLGGIILLPLLPR